MQRDPLGYVAGLALQEYMSSAPTDRVDPTGLKDRNLLRPGIVTLIGCENADVCIRTENDTWECGQFCPSPWGGDYQNDKVDGIYIDGKLYKIPNGCSLIITCGSMGSVLFTESNCLFGYNSVTEVFGNEFGRPPSDGWPGKPPPYPPLTPDEQLGLFEWGLILSNRHDYIRDYCRRNYPPGPERSECEQGAAYAVERKSHACDYCECEPDPDRCRLACYARLKSEWTGVWPRTRR